MYQEDLEQLLQQYGTQLSALYQKVDGFESKVSSLDQTVWGFKDKVQDENDRAYEQLSQLGGVLNQKLDLHKQQLEQEMVELQHQSHLQAKEHLQQAIAQLPPPQDKSPLLNPALVDQICEKVYEKSKARLDRVDGLQERLNDLTIKVIALETKTEHQAHLIHSQQQFIEEHLRPSETTQSPLRQKTRSRSCTKVRKHSSWELPPLKQDGHRIDDLKQYFEKQEEQWEQKKKEELEAWEKNREEERKALEKEKMEITGELSALRQALQEREEGVGKGGEVEQLRFELEQKVESQLFKNESRVNGLVESLKQRMEKYEGQSKHVSQFCEFTQNQVVSIETASKQSSQHCHQHLQSLWETMNLFNSRLHDN